MEGNPAVGSAVEGVEVIGGMGGWGVGGDHIMASLLRCQGDGRLGGGRRSYHGVTPEMSGGFMGKEDGHEWGMVCQLCS